MASSTRRNESPRYPAFHLAVDAIFQTWTALKLAVDHGQGGQKGKEIAVWIAGAVEDYFYLNDDLMDSEVAEFLGTLMNQELDTFVEDGSLEEIGDKLCFYFDACKDNKEEELASMLKKFTSEQAQSHAASSAAASKPLPDEHVSSDSDSGSDQEMEAR